MAEEIAKSHTLAPHHAGEYWYGLKWMAYVSDLRLQPEIADYHSSPVHLPIIPLCL